MAFTEVATLDSDVTIALGGVNKKTGKPNPGKIEGYYLGSKDVESKKSKNGVCKLHFFQTPKGNVGVWGKTDLDRKLSTVTPGTMTRAAFSSMKACPGKNDMYVYKVETDKANVIEVAGAGPDMDYSDTGVTDTNGSDDYAADDYGTEDDLDTDAPAADELPVEARQPRRAAAPAPAPDAARQKKVQELLNKARTGRTA